ncbi:glycoside hydrolase family 97 protein [Chitinophagaceae bacterium LB-8]|uniref:Glycoside hydrolase family 97 protein n=1 Tax=Paraflavisolibacter caeni TaxID=2982496 RepID=A0A9X2Y098_9BACT|nr:glycoside hydrolase family 97 protein [Paraflavisolibacter caeni]MCU7552746.1 glycoside hydrolase family 97 protein [Paraflavisolibacter caeni]
MQFKSFFLFLLVLAHMLVRAQQIIPGSQTTIQSPDNNLSVVFYQKSNEDRKRKLYYLVTYKNQTIIRESALDLQLDNRLSESAMALKVDTHARWMENLVVKKIMTASKDTSWQPVGGERKSIRDHYNAATIELVKDDNSIYPVHVQIRAYNEGAAIRFFFPENEKGTYYRVVAENTEFSLPEGTMAWHHLWAQAPYQLLPLSNWPNESERPLTMQLPNGWYACLAEAGMVDYSRTKFKLSKEKPNTIVTSMHGPADLISPFATPWRLIMVAEKPGALIENNYVLLNLNEPNKIKDTSWIRPGKIMRVMSQTTEDALANIDFAVDRGLQYVLFDWKWYGPAFSFASDATKVAIPNFDLPRIIQYGKEKGIGVWLYVNQQALLAQLDTLFTTYKKWGVAGVKFGFVQAGSHRWTTWVEEAIQKAAENGIMVNIHDDWRPTGEQRTWPNLMTAEGIRGNEEMPDATHNTVLPFTRYIAGAADYTICYFDKRIKTKHAHQLAMAAVYFSPLQTLFWYDKPASFEGEPELEFWKKIPTTWDETKVLQGTPGQFITTARRKGEEWFVGTLTNNEGRTVKVPLSFLPTGKKFIATIYSDDPKATTKTKVKVEKKKVNNKMVFTVNLLASGGQAVWLTPEVK